jgi:hypothetical protein
MAERDFDPHVGQVHLVDSVTSPYGLHRAKFEQRGRIPELEPIWEAIAPKDGRNVDVYGWMDEGGTGHLYLAWKEK